MGNSLLSINEGEEGTIPNEPVTNDQDELLAIDQGMADLLGFVEHNELFDSPPVVEDLMPTDSHPSTPST